MVANQDFVWSWVGGFDLLDYEGLAGAWENGSSVCDGHGDGSI